MFETRQDTQRPASVFANNYDGYDNPNPVEAPKHPKQHNTCDAQPSAGGVNQYQNRNQGEVALPHNCEKLRAVTRSFGNTFPILLHGFRDRWDAGTRTKEHSRVDLIG